ncbi:MAG: sulfatase [Halanaerobium sp.]
MVVIFYAPHSPVNPPQRFVDMYDPEELSLPEIGENEIIDSNLKDVTEEEWRKIKAYYLALVSHIDDCVGQIIDKLKEKDMFDNTIIVFTSDHGEYLGEHGRINKGMPGHDCITNMPFIISYPEEISGGKEIEALVEGVDYVPTILDFCGIQTPSFVEGKSCKELLAGQKEEHKESVLIEHFSPAGNQQTTIKTRKYSYFCDAEGNEKLYDLKNDPKEFCDVSQEDEYKNILADMRKKMIKRIQKAAYRSEKRDAPY